MENKVSMRIYAYLEDVLGSPIKVQVLRLLFKFPEKGFGIRELAGFLGVNHRSISSAVKSLEDNNLVHSQVVGRSHLITLDKESFLYEQLSPLFTKEALPLLIKLIRQGLPLRKVQLCAIFGSVAAKAERPASDIDLLIITPYKKEIENAVSQLLVQILRRFGNPLSPLIKSPKEFKTLNPPLKENIMKNNILVHGTW